MTSHPHSIASLAEKQFDLLPIGVCTVDRELIVQSWNKTLVEWTELPADDVIGTRILNHYPHLMSSRFLSRIDDVFQSCQPTDQDTADTQDDDGTWPRNHLAPENA